MPREPEREDPGIRWVLPISILGSSLGFIDATVVNIALPTIQEKLGMSLAGIQWVTNSYLLALASLVLIGGAAGDRWGTMKVFLSGLLVFLAASIFCGVATSSAVLLGGRLVQGAGAAFLMPTSLALITQSYSGEKRSRAIGTWAASGGLLMAMGPPIGGWLVSAIGWRAIFFVNIPVAAVAIGLSFLMSASAAEITERKLDVVGAFLATATLAGLTYGLVVFGEGKVAVGAISVGLGFILGTLFVIVERRASSPMIPIYLFESRTFAGVNAYTLLLYGALGAAIFLLPYSLIRIHHYSSATAGLAFMPLTLIFGLGSRFTGGLVGKISGRLLLMTGPIVAALGFGALAVFVGSSSYSIAFLPGLLLVGIGLTISVPALTTIVFESVSSADNGTASGINNAAARTGGLLATAALGLAFGASRAADVSPEVLTRAYQLVMWSCGVAAICCAIIAALTVQAREKNRDDALQS